MTHNPIATVLEYHERTKHHFQRYARSPGYMDWDTRPDPFRRFDGATILPLPEPPERERPTFDSLYGRCAGEPDPLTGETVSRLFYHALALSAWKQAPGTPPWSLRINPSSGALHPTEGYLVAGPVEGLGGEPAVYHYSPFRHALEQRVTLLADEWTEMKAALPEGSLLVGLTSIHWRESWKYGERAFRYCHHDVGHAIGALAYSAALLGRRIRLIPGIGDDELAQLLGLDRQEGAEAEHPDCLLAVYPARLHAPDVNEIAVPPGLLRRLRSLEFAGTPNKLSHGHHPWPAIEEVAGAARREAADGEKLKPGAVAAGDPPDTANGCEANGEDRGLAAERIIRARRSAVSMDGRTLMDRDAFYRLLERLQAKPDDSSKRGFPFDVWPWAPRVSLVLFVHRVRDLTPGVYALVRDPNHEASLRSSLRKEFRWQRPEGCPGGLRLFLLEEGDCRRAARAISCHQDIAADGVFSLGMLAEFEHFLKSAGSWFYPRLFWETGLIGQVLYLEAEAAGIRGTGIGCFFDDAMHELLGIGDRTWQSLYHFTVGGPVEDLRLQTIPPYAHLANQERDKSG